MQYRTLGNTGLTVSVLSYGASSLGGVFRSIDENEGIRAARLAIDLGINFIDVSPYYGLTRAEIVLGRALSGIPRDRYYLATKVGRYGDSEFDFSARRVTASVDESLSRLNVEYIDVIQCHDIEYGDLDQVVNETIPALRALRDRGKVRFIGVTGLPLSIFGYVLDHTEVDTILSYCRYCLNDTSLESFLPRLREKRVGVINASPWAWGSSRTAGCPHGIRPPARCETHAQGRLPSVARVALISPAWLSSSARPIRRLRRPWSELPARRISPGTCNGSQSRPILRCFRPSSRFSNRFIT